MHANIIFECYFNKMKEILRRLICWNLSRKAKCGDKDSFKVESNNEKCPWCVSIGGRPFKKGQGIALHKKKVHYWGEFICGQCPFKADFAKELVEHMQSEKHLNSVPCPNCKWKTPMLEIEPHYENCVKVIMVNCEVCSYQNMTYNSVLRHMKEKHFWGVFRLVILGEDGVMAPSSS